MESPTHLQIFTSASEAPKSPARNFHLFPVLPPELRIRIWRLALNRQRILKVVLWNGFLMHWVLNNAGITIPETHQNRDYGVFVDSNYYMPSKLFRVNRESRGVALAFYRVRLRCWLARESLNNNDIAKLSIIYFNPEYDFLQISVQGFNEGESRIIARFFHDLKTVHDPRNVGLLNLAMDINDVPSVVGDCDWDGSSLDPPLLQSFNETLTQLREVFFVQSQMTGRYVFGYFSGARTPENRMNLAFPIMARTGGFDRLRIDPRPISQALGQVFVNSDPRQMVARWKRFLHARFGGGAVPQPEYRVLLTMDSYENVRNQVDAQETLRKWRDVWLDEVSRLSWPVIGDCHEMVVKTAFGFWLFDIRAFGELPQNDADEFTSKFPCYMDLKEHWPELGSLDLS